MFWFFLGEVGFLSDDERPDLLHSHQGLGKPLPYALFPRGIIEGHVELFEVNAKADEIVEAIVRSARDRDRLYECGELGVGPEDVVEDGGELLRGPDEDCIIQQRCRYPEEGSVYQEDRRGSPRDLASVPGWVGETVGVCVYAQAQDTFEDLLGEGEQGESHWDGRREGGAKMWGAERMERGVEIYRMAPECIEDTIVRMLPRYANRTHCLSASAVRAELDRGSQRPKHEYGWCIVPRMVMRG